MRKWFLLAGCLHLLYLLPAQNYLPRFGDKSIKIAPAVPIRAYAFDHSNVSLIEGSLFYNATQRNAAYLLSIQPDRLLHRFHLNAKLPVKDSVYGGWESEGLSGHTLGHYLSACAMTYAYLRKPEFSQRIEYIVNELQRCQEARGTGYVGAIPNEDSIFTQVSRGEIRSGGFDLNGGWAPWYTVHKVMAGLLDACLYAGNRTALKIAKGMGDWVDKTIGHLPQDKLDLMLRCEFGGMNEVLANLYSITGDKKYLRLAYKFFDNFVMAPLSNKIDPMPGKHANTQVPKAIGSARLYELEGGEREKTIASFFWETMTGKHSYVIGGNSNYEYCGEPGKLNDRLSDNTAETCNTYNMLRLTRHLFAWQPDSRLMDYYERALYNHILASQNPETGMMCYFMPLRMGALKQFSDSFNTFTCCVGTGMENHSKYLESVYSRGEDESIYVNLFIPSFLDWREKNIGLWQSSDFPESNKVVFKVRSAPGKKIKIRIRVPGWVSGKPTIRINNQISEPVDFESGYMVIERSWKADDQLEIAFPVDLYTESMPDNPDRIAFLYGPIVLAGQLGREMPDPVYGPPVLLTDNRNVKDWILMERKPLHFRLNGVAKPNDVSLVPFYQVYDQHYNVYWDYFTPGAWEERRQAYQAERIKQQKLEERTIDVLRLGEMQPERDHNLKASEQSYTEMAMGRGGREVRNGGYFSFEMKVLPGVPSVLQLSYLGDDRGRHFDILVDGVRIATEELKGGPAGRFIDVEYDLPPALIKGKTKIEVRIQAHPKRTAGRVFSPRILRK